MIPLIKAESHTINFILLFIYFLSTYNVARLIQAFCMPVVVDMPDNAAGNSNNYQELQEHRYLIDAFVG